MAKDTSINKGLILSMGVAFLIQAGGFIWWMSGIQKFNVYLVYKDPLFLH